jgi:2-(3-amino-3-carboxypropyl)histidine synthase
MEEDRAQTDLGIAADIEEVHRQEEAELKQPKKRFIGRRTAAENAAKASPANNSSIEESSIQGEHRPILASPSMYVHD